MSLPRFLLTLIIVVTAHLLCCCCGGDAASPAASKHKLSVAEITTFLERGDCNGAIRYLQQQAESSRTPEWYDYMSQSYLVCSERTLNSQAERQAVSILDEGLRRFPDSARLTKAKAERLESLGDLEKARMLYARARAIAEGNINSGHSTDEDRDVLAELKTDSTRDRRSATIDSRVPVVSLDASSHWATRVSSLIVQGKCDEALVLLGPQGQRHSQIIWYELNAQANAVCYRMTKASSYREAAVRGLEEGIATFPRSSRLRLARGFVLEAIGDRVGADAAYREAEKVATENIASHPNAPATYDDRSVLESIKKRREQ